MTAPSSRARCSTSASARARRRGRRLSCRASDSEANATLSHPRRPTCRAATSRRTRRRRPLLRRVPAQRQGSAPTCWCRGPTARSSRRRRSSPPAWRPTSASTLDSRARPPPPDLQRAGDAGTSFPRPLAGPRRAAGSPASADRRESRTGQLPDRLDQRLPARRLNDVRGGLDLRRPRDRGLLQRGGRRRATFGITEHEGSALPRRRRRCATTTARGRSRCRPTCRSHVQAIDEFGMSLRSEPVWISGRPGRVALLVRRLPRGPRRAPTRDPARSRPRPLLRAGPADLRNRADPRARGGRSSDFGHDERVVGVPWDQALQPIFAAKCVGLPRRHRPAGEPVVHRSPTPRPAQSATWTFNLTAPRSPRWSSAAWTSSGGYSASHLSLMGPDMERHRARGQPRHLRRVQGLREAAPTRAARGRSRSSTRCSCSPSRPGRARLRRRTSPHAATWLRAHARASSTS